MGLRTIGKQVFPNICLAVFVSLVLTLAAAFAARFTRRADMLLPYGIDEPLGPLANIIRNALWLFVLFCIVHLVWRKDSSASAIPILLLTLQVFVGLIVMILLEGIWQSIQRGQWTNSLEPESGSVIVTFAALGQMVAYGIRRAI